MFTREYRKRLFILIAVLGVILALGRVFLVRGSSEGLKGQIGGNLAMLRSYPVIPKPLIPEFQDKSDIIEYIVKEAKKNDIDPATAVCVSFHESRFEPERVGDSGKSFGLWQIHEPSHNDPEEPDYISKEDSLDIKKSTAFAMKYLKTKPEIWTAYRNFCN